jgi:ABC-type transporter Mla maintaining outer membrane lipid asymmetry ATPase subunit MlaF
MTDKKLSTAGLYTSAGSRAYVIQDENLHVDRSNITMMHDGSGTGMTTRSCP